jgi:tetratricopeptide (TPR) repeat protein
MTGVRTIITGSLALLLAMPSLGIADAPHRTGASSQEVPLFDNLGSWHHKITTMESTAQRYFDQGLRLLYGFNHAEAIRAFEEATRIDPGAAMGYWGIALALGPNINMPMDPEQERRAFEAIRKASANAAAATAQERGYIAALEVRYGSPPGQDRQARDQAYADAMHRLVQAYPADPDAATLYAEALMDLHPWDFWTPKGEPKPGTLETMAVLERVLSKHPDHAGACHLFIHTVEASPEPGRALPCADRLADLAPGIGHLVHMPSHIYIRLGMYGKVADHNVHAAESDEHYLEGRHAEGVYPQMYYPHNVHFLWAGLVLQGRSQQAIQAARKLSELVGWDVYRQMPAVEFFSPTRLFTLARFGYWSALLKEPAPPADLAYSTAMWRYTRGLAFVAVGDYAAAEAEYRHLMALRDSISADRMVGHSRAHDLLNLAGAVLAGQRLAANGQFDDATGKLQKAVQLEDGLGYDEPPDWYYPVRETLGAVLVTAGRPAEAERGQTRI